MDEQRNITAILSLSHPHWHMTSAAQNDAIAQGIPVMLTGSISHSHR
ncbi:MAG: hypothetical protein ACR2PV_00870 [Gammaproteobacteria bacterium]